MKIFIDFPALDNYVAYLRATDKSQAQMDAAAQQVKALTDRLSASSTKLDSIVKNSKGT